MKKISVSKIVDFNRKSEKARITFINNLKRPKKDTESESGGDYWIISTSTIGNVFRYDKKELITKKIEEVAEKRAKTTYKISKDMYQRNISILNSFENYDFSKLKPISKLTYLPKPKGKLILIIRGVPLQIKPNYVFSFKENDLDKIGALWVVIKLNGFNIKEIALFTDAMHRYLKSNYKKFEVDPNYCIALDLESQKHIRYTEILKHKVNSELDALLEEIRKLMK